MSLQIQYTPLENYPDGDIFNMSINGRVDNDSFSEFEAKFEEIGKKAKCVLADLNDLAYINSLGIGTLVKLHKTLVKKGGSMKMYNVKPGIKKIFQITFLTKIFELFEDRAGAEASLALPK